MTTSSSSSFRHDAAIVGTVHIPSIPLLGREDEVRQVLELLDRDDLRIVTLLGPGGIGKTRLAQEVAGIIAPSFAHGARFVSLESVLDPALVPKVVAHAFGLRESAELSAPDMLADILSDRHLLLVLDNLEQVIQSSLWLSWLLIRSPRIKLLATSRIPLHIAGEQQFMVRPLPVSESGSEASAAVDLFIRHARTVNLAFDPDDASLRTISAICRRLDGLPLAIEMAAAWMKVLSPDSLLARLEHRLSMLSGNTHDVHPRLRSMTQAIGWSYELLSEAEQILFCRLSVFVGGFALDAVEFVATWPDSPRGDNGALEMLQSLIDQNLVQVDQDATRPAFRMLETIREYGIHRIESGDDDMAPAAHAGYYQHLAERAEVGLLGPDQAEWLDLLEREYPNIRLAKTWLEEHDRLDDAIELNSRILFFQNIRGHGVEALHRLMSWRERPELVPGSLSHGLVLMGIGRLLQNTGDLARSETMLAEAIEIFHEHGDQRHAAMAQGMLAAAYALMGVPDAAFSASEHALELARPLGLHRTVCMALSVLIWNASLAGDDARAKDLHEESVRIATEAGDRWSMSFNLVHLAQDAMNAGRLDEAERLAQEWRHLLEEIGSLHDLPKAWATLAWVARKRGQLHTAANYLDEATRIAEACGSRRLVAFLTMRSGIVAIGQGRLTEAARLLAGSLDVLGNRPQLLDLAETLDTFAALSVRAGDMVDAARFLGASTTLVSQANVSPEHLDFDAGGYRQRANLQTMLGDEAFGREYSAGAAWSMDQALSAIRSYRPTEEHTTETDLAREAIERAGLSPRELDVLRQMANGLSNQEIADALYLSLRTVTTHVTRILDKLQVPSRTAAVSFAIRNGMV